MNAHPCTVCGIIVLFTASELSQPKSRYAGKENVRLLCRKHLSQHTSPHQPTCSAPGSFGLLPSQFNTFTNAQVAFSLVTVILTFEDNAVLTSS